MTDSSTQSGTSTWKCTAAAQLVLMDAGKILLFFFPSFKSMRSITGHLVRLDGSAARGGKRRRQERAVSKGGMGGTWSRDVEGKKRMGQSRKWELRLLGEKQSEDQI